MQTLYKLQLGVRIGRGRFKILPQSVEEFLRNCLRISTEAYGLGGYWFLNRRSVVVDHNTISASRTFRSWQSLLPLNSVDCRFRQILDLSASLVPDLTRLLPSLLNH